MQGLKVGMTRLSVIVIWMIAIAIDQASARGVDPDAQRIVVSVTQEPRTLNTLTAESVSYTAQMLVHVNEGLMRYDRRRQLSGGVAQSWKVSPDRIEFQLRADAKWSDGTPVTAHDFVFAWQALLNPNTASPSANLASPIKNAAKVLSGALPSGELGVRAIAHDRLVVELEHPCAWCLKLMTNSIFYPIKQAFFEAAGDGYATSRTSHLSNGAFLISRWERGQRITIQKNKHYWNQEAVALNEIVFDYIGADSKTQLNLFRSGQIAVANLDRDTAPSASQLGYRLKTFPSGHLFNIQFSHQEALASANQNLRRAISLVIDKDTLVNRIVASPGTRIADSMFHDWLSVDGTRYIDARPPQKHRPDYQAARGYLAKARAELEPQRLQRLTLTINDTTLYRRVAEYVQSQLKNILQLDVAIDPQTTQMMVEKWRKGTTDMTLLTWPVDVDDPMDQISFLGDPSFRAVFQGLYAGDDMADLFYIARNASGLSARLDSIEGVHDFFDQKVTVMPLFETYGTAVVHPRVEGYRWQPVRGFADFRWARIAPE